MTESGTGNAISTATGGSGAKLVAVARYHRNVCYTTTLTGELSNDENNVIHAPAGCTVAGMRSAYQEISVSAPMTMSAGQLDGAAVALTFDFSADPIPINATDLFVQVAYRGPLGSEPDGIAVGLVDVSEPTYASVFNGTDYVLKNGQWVIPTGSDPAPDSLSSIQICDAQWQIYDSSTQGLPAGHIVRIAALRDSTTPSLSIQDAGMMTGTFGAVYLSWQGVQRQAINEQGTGFNPTPMAYRRSTVFADNGVYPFRYVPPLPNPVPSWRSLPAPMTAVSENIGTVITPGITACPF